MIIKENAFDESIKEAIKLGRKYMKTYNKAVEPTQQEWELALILFKNKLNEKI